MERPFFDRGSPYLGHPLLTAERSAEELDRIEELVGPISGPVLDIGCGFGRHVLELAVRGANVVGIDSSPAMIGHAEATAADVGLAVDVRLGDAELLRAPDGPSGFALALCLFTTFGQRNPLEPIDPTDDPERQMLDAISGALDPGGMLVVEVPDRHKLAGALVEREVLGTTTVERQLDAGTGLVRERFDVDGAAAFLLAYRVFDRTELTGLLTDAGFEIVHQLDSALVPPPPTFMTVVARKSR